MKVAELMWTKLETVGPDDTVGEAVGILAESHVYGLPVTDPRGRLLGVISASDVLRATAECATPEERDRLFMETTVRELMTPQPVTIKPEADVREAAQQMLYLDIHRLFIEEDGKLAGVISQSDVARGVATARI
jgi:CBS domain-containing protein